MLRRPDDRVPGRSPDWRPHDTDRSIDPFDAPPRSSRPPVPSRVAHRVLAPRTLLLVGGGVLAALATVLVFLTDDPDLLRVAVVAAGWAFVLATFVAGRRSSEEAETGVREAALRRTYEHELEREVAARRQYELELENDLRREAEGAMRTELDTLRRELTAVAELRDDVAALSVLRSELGQIGELRTELGRLRAELTEQLSSEMLVERIVMRTQASRVTSGDSTRTESSGGWREEAPRELTGGWPAVRLDGHTGTQQYERVRVDRSPPPLPWQTVTRVAPAAAPQPHHNPPAVPSYAPPPVPGALGPPAPSTEGYAFGFPEARHSRHAASGDDVEPRTDERLTTERPAAPRPMGAGYPFGPPAVPSAPPPPAPPVSEPSTGNGRLEQILAESGVLPATGSRRRRRYRDEDDAGDDVLSRVLRGD